LLATFGYDDLGRRASLTRGNGTVTGYGYDAASRLATLLNDFPAAGSDLTIGMAYNPAGQIVSRSGAHGAYAFTGHGSGTIASSANGLNQLSAQGGVALSHDSKGNMTFNGTRSFSYSSENLLTGASGGGQPAATLGYDALGRLSSIAAGGAETRLSYDGADRILEHDASGAFLRGYVFGPGGDEPLVWYDGNERWYFHADERGSVVAVSDAAGNAIAYNAYDEYGAPQPSGNAGRFGYTGQAWLPEIGLSYYKARMYWPIGGRFMQANPLGYGDGPNLYNAMGGDPVNLVDPFGTEDIFVTANIWGMKDRIEFSQLQRRLGNDRMPRETRERGADGGGEEIIVAAQKAQAQSSDHQDHYSLCANAFVRPIYVL
jgi:RHS repeat-associated protein